MVSACIIFLMLLTRLIPHPADFTPFLAFDLWLGRFFSFRWAIFVLLASLVISDGVLAFFYHTAWFGSWSIFTYSGFIGILCLGRVVSFSFLQALCVSGYFWLWSNFGVWLTGGMYALNAHGLQQCYVLALPFLGNSLIGSSVGLLVIRGLTSFANPFTFEPTKLIIR